MGAALWAWGYQLMLPDTLGYGIVVVVICLFAAWVALFIIRLICAPARVYTRLEDEKIKLQAELEQLRAKRATLTVSGPHIFKDPRYQSQVRWRMKVHNSGPAAADNLHMNLRHGNAEPKDATWVADYPYPVARVNPSFEDLKINPNNDEIYEIVCGWKSEAGPFFTTLHFRNHNQIQIQPEERWEFLYEATSSNAQTISFILQIFIEDDEVKVMRVN
jgi:hypothetical protein